MTFARWHALAACLFVSCSYPCVVMAQRPASPPAVAATTPSDRDVRTLNELLARPVSIDVTRVPLRRAIDALAENAGIPLQYHLQTIAAYPMLVTLHLVKVPLRVALEKVLEGTSLTVVADEAKRLAIIDATGGSVVRAATGIVTGQVTDVHTSRPLREVIVTLDDSVATVRTDDDGRYRFTGVAAGVHRVTVRFVGYARQSRMVTVTDNQTASMNFRLESSVNTLDQVVVTATGVQQYRELGHVVSVINADSLVRTTPITTVADLLTARIPGLQVTTSGGSVGGDIGLRIRGLTSTNLDPQPIVIVDGVRYRTSNVISNNSGIVVEDSRPNNVEPRSPLNDLNVNDIATVEVVKGPSATTLYGPDAANGVIIITTKHGVAGRTEWNVYVHPALHSAVPDGSMSGITTYQAWGHDPNSGTLFQGNCTLESQYRYQQCILDSVTKAPQQATNGNVTILAPSPLQGQVGTSVRGGTGALRYFASGNYDTESGPVTLPALSVEAYEQAHGVGTLPNSLKTPNTQQSVDLNMNFSTDFGTKGSLAVSAIYAQSTQRNITPTFYQSMATSGVPQPGVDTAQFYQSYANLLTTFAIQSSQMQARRLTGSASGTYHPVGWLTATGSLGTDLGNTTDNSFLPPNSLYDGFQSTATNYSRNNTGRSANASLTASGTSGVWSFRSSLGTQYSYQHMDGLNAYGYNLAPGSTSIATAENTSIGQVWNETATLGTYGEEVIGLRNRLFLNGALRVDGSTSYGDAYRPRLFPKVGLSWVASDEPFLRGIPGLNLLRVRTSFGAASRSPTSGMKLGAIQSGNPTIEGTSSLIYIRSTLANPVLRPEHTQEWEGGADATILGERVDLGLTAYRRRTNDQINLIREPDGLPGQQFVNEGDVTGHGVEVTAAWHAVRQPSWTMDVMFNYDFQTTRVVRLGQGLPDNFSLYGGWAVGYPLGAAFGQKVIGVADTVGGQADSIIFSNEVALSPTTFLGVLAPPRTVTVNPVVNLWRGYVQVSALFDRASDFIQQDPIITYGCAAAGLCLAGILKDTPAREQAAAVVDAEHFVPGDFTRWREFSITTRVPLRVMRWFNLGTMQVSLQGRNLALWTKYKATDPESQPGSGILPGASYGGAFGLPFPRTWSLRFDVLP